ncbi:hypothetical protein KVMX100_120873 [Klebsiella variicola]|nr:hypothetical protein KVMX100_120873 [Klebsiella variicola]
MLSTWQGTLSNGGQRGLRLGVDMDVVDIRSPFGLLAVLIAPDAPTSAGGQRPGAARCCRSGVLA